MEDKTQYLIPKRQFNFSWDILNYKYKKQERN